MLDVCSLRSSISELRILRKLGVETLAHAFFRETTSVQVLAPWLTDVFLTRSVKANHFADVWPHREGRCFRLCTSFFSNPVKPLPLHRALLVAERTSRLMYFPYHMSDDSHPYLWRDETWYGCCALGNSVTACCGKEICLSWVLSDFTCIYLHNKIISIPSCFFFHSMSWPDYLSWSKCCNNLLP